MDLRRRRETNGRQLVLDCLQPRDRCTEATAPHPVGRDGDAEDVRQRVLLGEVAVVGVVALGHSVIVAADADRGVDA